MNPYDSQDNGSSQGSSSGGVGIAPSNYVYGPANVHLLPCRIHHNGPAPVAAYFRPSVTAAAVATIVTHKDGDAVLGENSDTSDMFVGVRRAAHEDFVNGNTGKQEKVKTGGVAGVLGGSGDERDDGQVWEHFEDEPGLMQTARFRGRKLIGRKVALPEGVHGVVLREKQWPEGAREGNEELSSFWAAETAFREITVWGHDEVRQESTVDRCLEWMDVANSIHDP